MIEMRKIILVCLLVLIKITASAQKVRVFNTLALDYNFSERQASPDFQIGQSLLLESVFSLRINTAIKLSGNFVKKGELPNFNTESESYINLKKTNFSPSISIPVGVEAGYKKIAIGVAVDLISFNIGKKPDSLNYTLEKGGSPEGFEIRPNRFNFIVSKNTRALDACIYLVYTYNDSFSFRAGVWKHDVLYQSFITENNLRKKYDKFGFDEIRPFIGVRFNIEK
jgi:hypothetical protein